MSARLLSGRKRPRGTGCAGEWLGGQSRSRARRRLRGVIGWRVTLVVPTYQEADNIEPFLRAAAAALPGARVIVCDDGSPDGTGASADRVGHELGNVEVLHRPSKQGLGNAYRHGFRVALDGGADIVVQMDVDFSHPHAMLPDMVGRIRAGADVVIGSRYVPGGGTPDWPVYRRWLSKGGNRYARRLLRLAVRDATSGLRAYRSRSLQSIGVGTACQRLRLHAGDDSPAHRLGRPDRRGSAGVPRPRRRHIQDVGSNHGRDPRSRDVVGDVHTPPGRGPGVPDESGRSAPERPGRSPVVIDSAPARAPAVHGSQPGASRRRLRRTGCSPQPWR